VIELLTIFGTSFGQQIAGSMNSRARNRSSYRYHFLTAFLSHGFFVCSLGILIEGLAESTPLAAAYVIGGGTGSLLGTWASTRFERLLGATIN
jgi:hypothetical protein